MVGAGIIGSGLARLLLHANPRIQLSIVDQRLDRARALAQSLGLPADAAGECSADDVAALARRLEGCAVVINAAHPGANLNIMQAAVAARCHYLDLGGLFHTTRKQLLLAPEFERAGVMAILGIGAAPGLTNVMGAYAAAQLDRIESIDFSLGFGPLDMKFSGVFHPPYSVHTLMEEFADESVQFLDGELVTLPAQAGAQVISFPRPVGDVECIYTLHSEPATVPQTFASKGIRRVTWRLGAPEPAASFMRAYAAAGLGSKEYITVNGQKVRPVDVLAASIEANERNAPEMPRVAASVCIRADVIGTLDGTRTRVTADCVVQHDGSPPGLGCEMTALPAVIVAGLLAEQDPTLVRPGVFGPEQCVSPGHLFPPLAARGYRFTNTVHTDNAAHALANPAAYPPAVVDPAGAQAG